MTEGEVITKTNRLLTREVIAADLRSLGLGPGMVVIVHSALSSLGWVCGGPVAVVQALMDVLTPEGTLVMPTHSGDLSDPGKWQFPPVPSDWWDGIRASMPAYDPRYTPSRGMGRIPETFRTFPDVLRSDHPALSFAAWGWHSQAIIQNHAIDYSLGEQSPLARIYDLDGWVLLLGVGHDNNTSFHLAQYRLNELEHTSEGAPIWQDGQRIWRVYQDVNIDSDRFGELGADFEQAAPVQVGSVGCAPARLFRQRAAVDFAVTWLNSHPNPG